MQKKTKAPTLILSVLSLIVLGYILYMSVYNQIIAQSDGFFNMIIFAGILLLVFVLISLIIKLMAYTPTNDISPVLKYLLFMGGASLIVLAVFLRIKYSSSVPASESVYFKACQYINDGILSEGNDIMPSMLFDCAKFPFALFSSLIFDVIGLNAASIIYINLFLLAVTSIFVYLTVSVISDKICGLISFVTVLFMPGMAFSVYSYNSDLFFCTIFIITLYLYSLVINYSFKRSIFALITAILAGVFSGIMIFSEPVSAIIVITLLILAVINKKQTISNYIFILVFSIIALLGLTYLKSLILNKDLFEIISAGLSTYNPFRNNVLQETYTFSDVIKFLGTYIDDMNTHIVNNYYFLTNKSGNTYSSIQAVWLQLGNQLIYMFVIILAVADVLYLLKSVYNKVTPVYAVFISAFIVQFITAKNSSNNLFFGIILIVLAFATIQQMFLNHHPDISKMLLETESHEDINAGDESDGTSDDNSVDMQRAKALVFYDENDALYNQIKMEERNARHTDSVITTKVSTGFENGKYVYKEEAVEFLDEADKPMNKPVVAEVKAIPGTRPVEVVKPILADESVDLDDKDYFDEPDPIKEEGNSYFDETDPNIKDGFIIRKKLKPEKDKPEKVKSEKAKPGEHLNNPLPLPKPHVSKDLDFDVEIGDDDDFDY